MPDIYATINEQPIEMQERVADVLRMRADEPEIQSMLDRYLAAIEIPTGAKVLEIGCGTGAATRKIAELPGVSQVTALDPSSVFLDEVRQTLGDLKNIAFMEGDARSLQIDDESFDVVLSHTVLCHVPEPHGALQEAFRILTPGGQIVIFDGDYATLNIAVGDFDPLQACVDAMVENFAHDKWFMRRLPKMMDETGFNVRNSDGHGYVKISDPNYLLSVVDRGADAIVADGVIGPEIAGGLKAEARRRAEENQFYGLIMFACLVAQKPV